MVRKIYAPKKVKAGPSLIIDISSELVTGFFLKFINNHGRQDLREFDVINFECSDKGNSNHWFYLLHFFYELKSIHFWHPNVGDHWTIIPIVQSEMLQCQVRIRKSKYVKVQAH